MVLEGSRDSERGVDPRGGSLLSCQQRHFAFQPEPGERWRVGGAPCTAAHTRVHTHTHTHTRQRAGKRLDPWDSGPSGDSTGHSLASDPLWDGPRLGASTSSAPAHRPPDLPVSPQHPPQPPSPSFPADLLLAPGPLRHRRAPHPHPRPPAPTLLPVLGFLRE